ncbi:Flavodoxin reductases (ferredoxin-NADPH reductases) family 1 [Hyphomicrobium sulfonivorans]|uniref:Flavodoxin reductases (Ferredoxin-NADPH reductases) family 1 n=1 Tax=Hyphomicrobium sulfonivorans TaxID=121290 RepID=A0A109BJ84_HYPSL|nr:pyridoxamine 5'-phosphate oxidase family protein [Hyphomicrobium sulfonivorans]KWT69515.1 Flavodoxin reductases (ferredoxin-NADPH reductases) family 1 [Hyphomicrobium sulfonivorans]
MTRPVSDVAFSAAVKAEQLKRGSRAQYAHMEQGRGWPNMITADLAAVLAETRSIYLGTANADGQPYIQHRGGPAGFLKVLDDRTIGFADLAGNRQYITIGNLAENPRAFMFVMDYARQRRVKLWGRARVAENDDTLLARLLPDQGNLIGERSILFTVDAWDRNCRQQIPRMVAFEDVEAALRVYRQRITDLETVLTRAGVALPD